MGVIELDVSLDRQEWSSLPMGTKEKSFQVACPLIVSRVTVISYGRVLASGSLPF